MALEHPSARCRRGQGGAELNHEKCRVVALSAQYHWYGAWAWSGCRGSRRIRRCGRAELALRRLGCASSGRLEELLTAHFRAAVVRVERRDDHHPHCGTDI